MVNKPLIRPYFWGVRLGGWLTSHEIRHLNVFHVFKFMFCFASGSSISYFIIFFFHPNLLLPPSPEEKETTPWKINIEHNHEGLVQIVFLSFIVWWLSVPAVNLPGCSPNCSSGFFQTQAICVPFWAVIKTFCDNSMTVVGFIGLYVRNPLSSRITIPISINWVVSSVSSAKKNQRNYPPRWSVFFAPGCLFFSSAFQWNNWGADITSFSIIASGHAAGIPEFTDIKKIWAEKTVIPKAEIHGILGRGFPD